MQKWLAIAALLMLSTLSKAGTATAEDYESGFGFGISVPNVWLVLTQSEVTNSADVFLGDGGVFGLGSVPLEMRRAVYDRVQAGELEIFYRREDTPGSFIDNVNILMQSAPDHLDLEAIKTQVEMIPEVLNIHHMHAWMLTDRDIHMEAHVELNTDLALSQVKSIQHDIELLLKKGFKVRHVTLQFEYLTNHAPSLIHTKTE